MIRISQISKDSKPHLFVEGTLSDGWVSALETSWLEAQAQLNGEPLRIDLSGVTYVDDKGRELLARMIRDGAQLCATGIMTRAIIEELTKEIESERDSGGGIQAEAAQVHALSRRLMMATQSTPENLGQTNNQTERSNNHVNISLTRRIR